MKPNGKPQEEVKPIKSSPNIGVSATGSSYRCIMGKRGEVLCECDGTGIAVMRCVNEIAAFEGRLKLNESKGRDKEAAAAKTVQSKMKSIRNSMVKCVDHAMECLSAWSD